MTNVEPSAVRKSHNPTFASISCNASRAEDSREQGIHGDMDTAHRELEVAAKDSNGHDDVQEDGGPEEEQEQASTQDHDATDGIEELHRIAWEHHIPDLYAHSFGQDDYLRDCTLQLVIMHRPPGLSSMGRTLALGPVIEHAAEAPAACGSLEPSAKRQKPCVDSSRPASSSKAAAAAAVAAHPQAASNRQDRVLLAPPLPAHRAALCRARFFLNQLQSWKRPSPPARHQSNCCITGAAASAPAKPEPVQEAGSRGSPPMCAQQPQTHLQYPVLELPLSGPHEVAPALEAVRFLYTGTLRSRTARELLLVRRQASAMGCAHCEAACDAACGALPPLSAEDGCTVLKHLFFERLAGRMEDEGGMWVMQRCAAVLVGALGSAQQCLASFERRAHLVQLPFCALEAVLASDELQADSENSVLLMLLAWAKHQQCPPDKFRSLLRYVRLGRLGPSYMDSVLPALLPEAYRVSAQQQADLVRFSRLAAAGDGNCYGSNSHLQTGHSPNHLQQQQQAEDVQHREERSLAALLCGSSGCCRAMWFASPRRGGICADAPATLVWELPVNVLAAALGRMPPGTAAQPTQAHSGSDGCVIGGAGGANGNGSGVGGAATKVQSAMLGCVCGYEFQLLVKVYQDRAGLFMRVAPPAWLALAGGAAPLPVSITHSVSVGRPAASAAVSEQAHTARGGPLGEVHDAGTGGKWRGDKGFFAALAPGELRSAAAWHAKYADPGSNCIRITLCVSRVS